jgi:hypothetical protein
MAKAFSLGYESHKFNRFIERELKNMTTGQPVMVEASASKLVELIIDNTPVRSGRARAGWSAFADRHNVPYTITGPNVTSEGINAGKQESSFDVARSGLKIEIRITNSVSYIEPLEFGHSQKAPAGMVRLAMRTFQSDFTDIAREHIMDQIIDADRKTK